MDQSSRLSTSSKGKRKPIFSKNENSPVARLADDLSRNSSTAFPNRNLSPHQHSPSPPRIIVHSPIESRVNSAMRPSSSHLNSTVRINYSQPKIVIQQNPHVIYHQRATPIPTRVAPPPVVFFQQIRPTVQPAFYQTQPLPQPKATPQKPNPLYQTQPITKESKKQNRVAYSVANLNVRPELVGVERVMKEIDSNKVEKDVKFAPEGWESFYQGKERRTWCESKEKQRFYHSKGESTQWREGFEEGEREKSGEGSGFSRFRESEDEEVSKLYQINCLLSENYKMLYDQFFSMKREVREWEVVEEETFLKKSMGQIESIFNLHTNQALSQIHHLHSSKPLRKVGRSRAGSKLTNLYA